MLETQPTAGAQTAPEDAQVEPTTREKVGWLEERLQLSALQDKYGPDIEIEVHQPEAFFHLASVKQGLTVEQIAKEFKLETLREYLARSRQQREERLRGHGAERGKDATEKR